MNEVVGQRQAGYLGDLLRWLRARRGLDPDALDQLLTLSTLIDDARLVVTGHLSGLPEDIEAAGKAFIRLDHLLNGPDGEMRAVLK